MKKIKECEIIRWGFKYIIRHIRKGLNSALYKLQVIDDKIEIKEWVYDRNKIEANLIEYNKTHYKKAYTSKFY